MESQENHQQQEGQEPFKKPILVGKIGRLPKKIQLNSDATVAVTLKEVVTTQKNEEPSEPNEVETPPAKVPISLLKKGAEKSPIPYTQPAWSGLPERGDKKYSFDVLKNGSIIESVNLMGKEFWVFGRLDNCDICMQHPTISRYIFIVYYHFGLKKL